MLMFLYQLFLSLYSYDVECLLSMPSYSEALGSQTAAQDVARTGLEVDCPTQKLLLSSLLRSSFQVLLFT